MAILITRPKPNAQLTLNYLQRHLKPEYRDDIYILPLSETVALKITEKKIKADCVLVSSATSFQYLPSFLLSQIQNLPLYSIGKKTTKAARKSGMNSIVSTFENGQDFIDRAKIDINSSLLYLFGKRHIEEFLCLLHKKFKNLHSLELYDTKPIIPSLEDLAKLPEKLDVVLLYSALAAENLEPLQTVIGQNTIFLCLSPRIAHSIPTVFNQKIIIAEKPNEQSLLKSLCLLKK